jgi:hypothetical protein
MQKLKLNPDSLVVQTFEAAGENEARGTVRAHDSWGTTGGPYYCDADCISSNRSCVAVGDTCGSGC